MAVEIETSTDTVEEVKAALGESVEIDEAPAAEEKPPAKPAKEVKVEPKAETDDGEADEQQTGEEEEPAEEPGEKAKTKEVEPPKKAAPTHVPLSRLNEEIRKREVAEAKLAARATLAEEKPDAESEEPAQPENFSGKPEPEIDGFMKDVDQFDPAAVNKAIAAYTKAHSAWSREEARAEVAYQQRVDAAETARMERTKLFRDTVPQVLKVRPDYQEVIDDNKDVNMSQTMADFMYESEIGPFMLLHLIENPDDRAKVVALQSVRKQLRAMEELETQLAAELKPAEGDEAEEEKPAGKPKTLIPPKKTVSKTPLPPTRIKPAGPGPKSLEELAGPPDRTGIDIEFSPEYERAVKARRGT